jgi:hypothetical protein
MKKPSIDEMSKSQALKIGKPNNLKVFVNKKTKGFKQDRLQSVTVTCAKYKSPVLNITYC